MSHGCFELLHVDLTSIIRKAACPVLFRSSREASTFHVVETLSFAVLRTIEIVRFETCTVQHAFCKPHSNGKPPVLHEYHDYRSASRGQ